MAGPAALPLRPRWPAGAGPEYPGGGRNSGWTQPTVTRKQPAEFLEDKGHLKTGDGQNL